MAPIDGLTSKTKRVCCAAISNGPIPPIVDGMAVARLEVEFNSNMTQIKAFNVSY